MRFLTGSAQCFDLNHCYPDLSLFPGLVESSDPVPNSEHCYLSCWKIGCSVRQRIDHVVNRSRNYLPALAESRVYLKSYLKWPPVPGFPAEPSAPPSARTVSVGPADSVVADLLDSVDSERGCFYSLPAAVRFDHHPLSGF